MRFDNRLQICEELSVLRQRERPCSALLHKADWKQLVEAKTADGKPHRRTAQRRDAQRWEVSVRGGELPVTRRVQAEAE